MNDPQTLEDKLAVLLARLRTSHSDEVAWRELYVELWPFVVTIVFRRLKERNAAEDVAQEVFIRLLKNPTFDTIADASQFRAYVWRVSVNCANTHLHNLNRDLRNTEALRDLESDAPAAVPVNTEDRLLVGEAISIAASALAADDRKLLGLFFEGYSLSEVARELGISYSAVGVRLHRLKRKLRKLLK